MMTRSLRKFALTAHITFSVGWFGAVAGFLALAIAGLISADALLVRSSYLTMELIGWFVIVPACIGTLLTGLVQSLGTKWGLFKHYWVLVKLVLTVLATLVLFLHMKPISYVANVAAVSALADSELRGLRIQLIADAGAALLVLLVAIALSVYKPWGRTRFGETGLPVSTEKVQATEIETSKPWKLYALAGLIGLVILMFLVLHLKEGGMHHH